MNICSFDINPQSEELHGMTDYEAEIEYRNQTSSGKKGDNK